MGCILGLAVAIMVAAIFDPISHCNQVPMAANKDK
jgi:hypothetical protein